MHIHNDSLRKAYYRVKAANVVDRIKQVVKSPHDEGKVVEPPEEDEIEGIPDSENNKDETEPATPTSHNTPADPEFDTENTISGTGDGPSMETRRNY